MARVTIAQLEGRLADASEQLERVTERAEGLAATLEARTADLRVTTLALEEVAVRAGILRCRGIAREALQEIERSARRIPTSKVEPSGYVPGGSVEDGDYDPPEVRS